MTLQRINENGTLGLHDLAELEPCKRWLLYPAASGASYFKDFLREQRPDLLERVVALSDRDPSKWELLQEGHRVAPLRELAGLGIDCVVVCAGGKFDDMVPGLRELLGPDLPMLLADDIREYLNWSAQRSALARSTQDRDAASLDLAGYSRFFHSLPLGRDAYTLSRKGALTYRHLEQLDLPKRMDGKSVLDLGASDCFYGLEALARGADRLACLETFAWEEQDGPDKLSFVRGHFGMDFEELRLDANEVTAADVGSFDYVLSLGLYYHLRDPFRFLRNLRAITRERLFLSGRTVHLPAPDPFRATGEAASLCLMSNRGYGKWTPNTKCLVDMLHVAGFENVRVTFDFCPAGSMIASTALQAW